MILANKFNNWSKIEGAIKDQKFVREFVWIIYFNNISRAIILVNLGLFRDFCFLLFGPQQEQQSHSCVNLLLLYFSHIGNFENFVLISTFRKIFQVINMNCDDQPESQWNGIVSILSFLIRGIRFESPYRWKTQKKTYRYVVDG